MTEIDNLKKQYRPLTIYKASAGSGKTFTLSVEYIKLLIKNPFAYRNILAVTFTNKATEEMKSRIISQLYGIWKQLPSSSDYIEQLKKELRTELGENPEKLMSTRSGTALRNIIHDYSYFRIETIDKFFKSVLLNLARELDLTANLRVELNDYQIEQQAIDKLIEDLSPEDNVFKWILSYINENIQEDKNWNVISSIKSFGENIFKEDYKQYSEKLKGILDNNIFFEKFKKTMCSIMVAEKERMLQKAKEFDISLAENQLTYEDFAYKDKGVCGYFKKIKEGRFDDTIKTRRVEDALNSPESWIPKSSKDKAKTSLIKSLVEEKLIKILKESEEENGGIRHETWKKYKSAELILRHMNQLRLLGTIEKKVRELNAETNSFLLSDTQTLLHSLIKGSDTPFVFEKIGTQIRHIMIDEFQDTSTVQWQNFKVLLEECISHEPYGSLIVGDVKQSIYRWRSGDWRLLNHIENEFPNANEKLSLEFLDTNYRSEPNIVKFNNIFFKHASDIEYDMLEKEDPELAQQLSTAYNDIAQKTSPKKTIQQGKVEITLFRSDNYIEETLEKISQTVEAMIDSGIKPKDIAIIVRENKKIQMIADYFSNNHPNIHIVSDEAFRLENSIAIGIIINALRFLSNPDNKIARAYISRAYSRYVKGIINPMDEVFPEEFNAQRDYLISLPLYDLIERLFAILSLDKIRGQGAYICSFFDNLNLFIADNTPDIDSFLEEWDNNICTKTIQADDVDGVRLITIHKSKGLEFENVIIPFCDWKLNRMRSIWCKPKIAPYNELPMVSVDYSKTNMKGTIFDEDYKEEHLQDTVDNLNLLYVAFTRAEKNLFIFGKGSASSKTKSNEDTSNIGTNRSCIIEKCLPEVAKELDGATIENEGKNVEPIVFSYGDLLVPIKKIKKEKDKDLNIFRQTYKNVNINICSHKNRAVFKQSNKSKEFVESDEEQNRDKYIIRGNVLHKIFSSIHTKNDIDDVLKNLEFEGVITSKDETLSQLKETLRKSLTNPLVSDWFSEKWNLFNECNILSTSHDHEGLTIYEMHRPDRVMTDGKQLIVVDFKFGKLHNNKYYDQVKEYMKLFNKMGYKNIRGYLWYVLENEVEEVNND